MPPRIFEIEKYAELPLWAQVLIASRIARRAIVELPTTVTQKDYDQFVSVCDSLDECAIRGERSAEAKSLFDKQLRYQPSRDSTAASQALYYAIDAAHAAESSMDFEAAESACTGSVYKAIAAAAESAFMNPIRIAIFVAADIDQLNFACKSGAAHRYYGLGKEVVGNMIPVHPPEKRADVAPKRPGRSDQMPDEIR